MGTGHHHDPQGLTFYFEPYDGLEWEGEHSQLDFDFAYQDALDNIRHELPQNWHWCADENVWHNRALVLAECGLYELTLCEDSGGYGYFYLTVRIANRLIYESSPALPLAIANVHRSTNKLADILGKVLGPLRRGSSWTSSDFYDFEPMKQRGFCI